MKKQVKVLCFIDRLERGGIQTLALNLMNQFDKKKIQVDFLLFDDGTEYSLEQVFRDMGSKIYKVISPSKKTVFRCMRELDMFFKKHHGDYNVIHAHSSSKGILPLWYARKYDIKTRISHSHNTKFQSINPITIAVGNLLMIPLCLVATDYFACSEIAGNWLFKHWYAKNQSIHIVKNCIDVEEFKFNETVRNEERVKYGIEDNIVIGNVARFSHQKNHAFMLQIFKAILDIEPKAILVLAGTGELLDETVKIAEKLGIKDKVMFLGFKNNVARLLQAFDLFLMPSLYEGLPFVGVEAQAAGLPCVFSDSISEEIELCESTIMISLNESPNLWAKKVINLVKKHIRGDTSEIIRLKHFDIKVEAKKIEQFYIKNSK